MAKKPTPHPYADRLTFDRIMLLIATLVNHPGIGHSDTETSDSKYHDALLEVRSQLQKIAAEFNIQFPENYPATPTIRKDLETLRHYGILDKRMYRLGYYLGTGAMNRDELIFAFQAIASQAKYQGNPQARRICEKLTKLLRGLDIELKGELFYPVREHLNRAIIYTDPVEMIDRQNNQHNLFQKLDIVETAIVRGQAIELYRQSNYYGKSHLGFRRIWPLQLIYHDIAWYLICQYCDNGHLTVERVNRFTDYCEIIDAEGRGSAAQLQSLKIAQKLLKNGWGLFLGKPEQQQAELQGTLKLQKVKVRFFEKVVGFILEGDRRHPRQKIKEGPRDSFGDLLYVDYWIDLPDRSLNEFSLWVNKHMENVQVMWPPSLVEKHRQAARDLAARYT
ncbi:WYL domain-containing protein [Microcoleus sp. LEGE 07076]|uniref:helix-turn-helix transcriptional regulator n=1 Tax=Microcoleus sp. LEGE 07076 TaxID=915322 RepID=UPI00188089F5|nr:WYL domain-containing protein [Microcoleus sp. LEGE 07076]MBE9186520.1 WYL domain-containing protein [Microcoleus sp. LEGE 07076]